MAKQVAAAVGRAGAQAVAVGITLSDFPAKMQREIKATTGVVQAAAKAFKTFREITDEHGKEVYELYQRCKAHRPDMTDADFARLFDPSVPTHPRAKDGIDGYQQNRTYNSIRYMFTQQKNIARKEKAAAAGVEGQQGKYTEASAAKDKFIRTFATLVALARDPEPILAAFSNVFGLTGPQRKTLRDRLAMAEPFIEVEKITKPINFAEASLHHMPGETAGRTKGIVEVGNAKAGEVVELQRVRDEQAAKLAGNRGAQAARAAALAAAGNKRRAG